MEKGKEKKGSKETQRKNDAGNNTTPTMDIKTRRPLQAANGDDNDKVVAKIGYTSSSSDDERVHTPPLIVRVMQEVMAKATRSP